MLIVSNNIRDSYYLQSLLVIYSANVSVILPVKGGLCTLKRNPLLVEQEPIKST
jgi:hypothetical protein